MIINRGADFVTNKEAGAIFKPSPSPSPRVYDSGYKLRLYIDL